MPSIFKRVLGNKASPTQSDKPAPSPPPPPAQARPQSLPLHQTLPTQQNAQRYSQQPRPMQSPSGSYYSQPNAPYRSSVSSNSPQTGYSQYGSQYGNYPSHSGSPQMGSPHIGSSHRGSPHTGYSQQSAPIAGRQSYVGSYGSQSPLWGSIQSPPASFQADQISPAEIFESHADACAGRQDFNAAVVMYTQALQYAPGSAPLYCKRSYSYMLSSPPNFDAAMEDASAAIQLDPTYWRGWMQQGHVRLRNGNIRGAADAFGVAVDFANGDDKTAAQRSLEDALMRLAQSPPLPQPTPEYEQSMHDDYISVGMTQPAEGDYKPSQPTQPAQDEYKSPQSTKMIQDEYRSSQSDEPIQEDHRSPLSAHSLEDDYNFSEPPEEEEVEEPRLRRLSLPPVLPPLPDILDTPIMSNEFSSPPVIQAPTPKPVPPSAFLETSQTPLYSPATKSPQQLEMLPATVFKPQPSPASQARSLAQAQQLTVLPRDAPVSQQQPPLMLLAHRSQQSPQPQPQLPATEEVQKPSHGPTPTQSALEPAVQFPIQVPSQASGQSLGQNQAHSQIPGQGQAPGQVSNQASGHVPGQAPGQSLGQAASIPPNQTQVQHQPQRPAQPPSQPQNHVPIIRIPQAPNHTASQPQSETQSQTTSSVPSASPIPLTSPIPSGSAVPSASPLPSQIPIAESASPASISSIPIMLSQQHYSFHQNTPSPQTSSNQSPRLYLPSPANQAGGSPMNTDSASWLSSRTSSTASITSSAGPKSQTITVKPAPTQLSDTRPQRRTPITRGYNASSVSQTAVSSLPFGLYDSLRSLRQYAAASSSASRGAMTEDAFNTQMGQLQDILTIKNKGSLSIRPYTASGNIDAIRLFYVGLAQSELTAREIRTPTYLHPSFYSQAVDTMNYPGNTFLDMDCESSAYYEGRLPGTVGISGYSEEYREHQLSISPVHPFALEGLQSMPVMPLNFLVDRIRTLLVSPNMEDNESLREVLGLSELGGLQDGIEQLDADRQRVIESICLAMNRNTFEHPTRFVDLAKARNVSNHTLGGPTQGVGLHNFLQQILVGAELLIRLRKEPVSTSYTGLVTDSVSALIVLVDLWMQNVAISGPTPVPPTHPLKSAQLPYSLYSRVHQRQAEGLVRFAEAIEWPYMEEVRYYMNHAYNDLTSGKPIGYDICDWLFGLVLPGKIFRHRILSCLVYASPTTRPVNAALHFEDGLVVRDRSYWPKRSVLGRVLGASKDAKSTCGWIGPVVAPAGVSNGWVRVAAPRVDCPTPCDPNLTSLEDLGFGMLGPQDSMDEIMTNMADPSEWIQVSPAPRPASAVTRSRIKQIRLTESSPQATTASKPASTTSGKEYSATIVFDINGKEVTYTMNSNPLFVCPHPCVGVHSLHRRQAQTYLSSIVRAADLKEVKPPKNKFLIIDATCEGDEVVARSWCAERGRHAIVRKGSETCFACAALMANARSGLGFNVLIWSN